MPIIIRKYSHKDKKQLIDIMNRFQDYIVAVDNMKRTRRSPDYGKEYVKKTLKELRRHQGILYVGETGERKIVGIVAGIIEKPTRISKFESIPNKSGRVTELYLDPEYRGQKMGKMLMQTIEQYFQKKQCTVIFVEVFAPNQSAYDFYKRSGYRDRDYNLIKVL